MTEWKEVRSGAEQKPSELDLTSSQTTVYERKNIRQETFTEQETEITMWVYDER